jgi:hypothetical protein
MGRAELSVASRKSKRPVVLHLDLAVAHDLLQALTQALEPHTSNIGKLEKSLPKGGPVKGMGPKAKSGVKEQSARRKRSTGKSPKRKAAKAKSPKGNGAKKSR